MILETLPIYESWDLATSPLPTRSYLYSLKPLGIGTLLGESFTSYLARLAQAHGISVSTLIRYKLTPRLLLCNQSPGLTEGSSLKTGFETWFKQPKLLQETLAETWLDSTEQVVQIVAVLRDLTLRQDLSYLTLLPLGSLFSLRHVFHTEQLWCPACYQEYRETEATLYKPLLWTLDVVNVCPRHQCYLQTWCLGCHSPQVFLDLQGQMGYCSECGFWLGRSLGPGCHYTRTKNTEWDFWVAEAVGQVLAAMPLLTQMTPELCKQRERKPQLTAFLKRCYKLGLSPMTELVSLASTDFVSKN